MVDLVPQYVQRVHNIVGLSKVFRHDILNHESMHGICRLALEDSGDYWLGYGAVIENGPRKDGSSGMVTSRTTRRSDLVLELLRACLTCLPPWLIFLLRTG
ncbi:hypothetical protein F4776DRAFT_646357 [Hypoxylon sp. NC0597]|nr:hypothetical protein F4776DRAFT_646357 [Hypoxylon sp. NC0597]